MVHNMSALRNILPCNDIIEFEFRKKPYTIYISEVIAFPQAYAAAMLVYSRIRDFPNAIVIDIGGLMVRYIHVKGVKSLKLQHFMCKYPLYSFFFMAYAFS